MFFNLKYEELDAIFFIRVPIAFYFGHYTMVLTVLFLARGRHYFQDTLTNHVIMGVLFSIILPVCDEQG